MKIFHSNNVQGLKIHWCENANYRTILPKVDFFFYIFHFQKFFSEFSYNIPLTNIFLTSPIRILFQILSSYRLSCYHCRLYLNKLQYTKGKPIDTNRTSIGNRSKKNVNSIDIRSISIELVFNLHFIRILKGIAHCKYQSKSIELIE